MLRSAFFLLSVLSLVSCAPERMPSAAAAPEWRQLKIALCQIVCLDGDRAGNLRRIEHALAAAAEGGAQIACFPETALLGWVNPDAHERARPIPGEDTEALGALARRHRIWICCGLAEKDGDRLHDTVVLVDADGNLAGSHRKINILSSLMEPPYMPGSDVGTIQTPFGTIGLLVCADSFHEETLGRMAALKPDLALVPYGWAAPEDWWPGHGEALLKTVSHAARAIGAPVIGTDVVGAITNGPWRGYVYGGRSVAVDRDGILLARCRDRVADVRIVTLER